MKGGAELPRIGYSNRNDETVRNLSRSTNKNFHFDAWPDLWRLSYAVEYGNSARAHAAPLEMKEHQHAVRKEDFDALLALFSHDRDEAGLGYERVRTRLVRFFEFRGCSDAEALADETLNRVALKAGGFDKSKDVKLTSYVYGFAANVYREYARSPRPREQVIDADDFIYQLRAPQPNDDNEELFTCLTSCLWKLEPGDRELVAEYYSREKQEKIDTRRRMAERLGCRLEVLHTRVFRLKAALRKCMSRCVEGI